MQSVRALTVAKKETEIRELLGSDESIFQLKLCNSTLLTISTKHKPTIHGSDCGCQKGGLLTLPTGAK